MRLLVHVALAVIAIQSMAYAGPRDTTFADGGLTVTLEGIWSKRPTAPDGPLVYRSSDGREQVTITVMPSDKELNAKQRRGTVKALVGHRREAERRDMGDRAEPVAFSERGAVHTAHHFGVDPEAHHFFGTLVVCSVTGAWVLFYESADTSEKAFRERARKAQETVKVNQRRKLR